MVKSLLIAVVADHGVSYASPHFLSPFLFLVSLPTTIHLITIGIYKRVSFIAEIILILPTLPKEERGRQLILLYKCDLSPFYRT